MACEIVFQPMFQTREKPNLHFEFYLRNVTDGMRSPCLRPVAFFFVRWSSQLQKKIDNVLQPVIEFVSLSRAIEDVGLDALWLAC